MQHTTNYNLPQWEAGDRVKRADFNGAMSAIDAALAGGIQIATGAYTGNGAATRTFSLGFTPKVVLLVEKHGYAYINQRQFGGLFMPDYPVMLDNRTVAEIVDGGFRVFYYEDINNFVYANLNNSEYRYLAIG